MRHIALDRAATSNPAARALPRPRGRPEVCGTKTSALRLSSTYIYNLARDNVTQSGYSAAGFFGSLLTTALGYLPESAGGFGVRCWPCAERCAQQASQMLALC